MEKRKNKRLDQCNNKRLYIDLQEYDQPKRFAIMNLDLLPMIWKNYNLNGMEGRVFIELCMQYDNAHESNRDPLNWSYNDIANRVNCSTEMARKAIRQLIKLKLIVVIGERKGRAKTQYLPNINLIQEQLLNYLNLS